MNSKEETQKYIHDYVLRRPHVVILGAGATVATIPKGDKNGLKCSVMNNFIQELGLSEILSGIRLETSSLNLEDIYSELDSKSEYHDIRHRLEEKISERFSQFELPDTPTIYDLLLLSMRSKDYIFSFNWDDLLLQAYLRVYPITSDLPQIGFLHGNIGVGVCDSCGEVQQYRNKECYKCGCPSLHIPKLLFPVKKKDYSSDPYIRSSWKNFLEVLKVAGILTIFGYSAPKTDVEAIKAMKVAFSSTFRRYDHIEIIDIKPRSELFETWSDFIEPTNDHVDFFSSIFDSMLCKFPRRSIEGYYLRYFKTWFGKSKIELQDNSDFQELRELLFPLLENEAHDNYDVIMAPYRK